jgi:hypothetical protein
MEHRAHNTSTRYLAKTFKSMRWFSTLDEARGFIAKAKAKDAELLYSIIEVKETVIEVSPL